MRRSLKAPIAGSNNDAEWGGRWGLCATATLFSLAFALVLGAGTALAAAPEVKISPIATPGYTSAQVSGEINTHGEFDQWTFEVSSDGGATWAPTNLTNLEISETLTPVGELGPIEGLTAGTTYKVRLTGTNFAETNSTSESENPEFTTKPVAPLRVTLDPVTAKTDSTAILKGTVDPDSPGGLDDEGKSAYGTSYHFDCSPACPGLSGSVPAEAVGAEIQVQAEAKDLEPNTEYVIHLTAENGGGSVTAGPQRFTTDEAVPDVASGAGVATAPGVFALEGTVNPRNSLLTDCHFDWGPTDSYGRSIPCDSVPATSNRPTFVSATLSGLTVGAEYHFSLAASDAAGTSRTPDATFVADERCLNEGVREQQASTFLPECRAWELVSEPYKEGFSASPFGVSPDGSRVLYLSNGNFNGNSSGGAAAIGGNAYVADRGPGWATEPIAPSRSAFESGGTPAITSSDLMSSIWIASPVGDPAMDSGLYQRGPGASMTRIGPAAPGMSPPIASGDLSRVAFEVTNSRWTDSGLEAGAPRIYEYQGVGAVRPTLASADNNGDPLDPGCGTSIGAGPSYAMDYAMSTDGRALFFAAGCTGAQIFARLAHGTVVAASASECDRGVADPCQDEPLDATYNGAAANGSVVYFTTTNQLVDGDTDTTNDLYACSIPSAEASPVGRLNKCLSLTEVSGETSGAQVQGVLRVSEDGNRVYYVARGALTSGVGATGEAPTAGGDNLYMWERSASSGSAGRTAFIGALESSDSQLWIGPRYQSTEDSQTTASGEFLLLPVHTPMIDSGPEADRDGGAIDIYRYDAVTGSLVRVSADSSGRGGNDPDDPALIHRVEKFTNSPTEAHGAIAEDGAVVFQTNESLSPYDRNTVNDAYLWRDGRLSLVSSGDARSFDRDGGGVPPLITPGGKDIFLMTANRMTANDTDTQFDVYDVRVGGGFAFPGSQPCVGEACRPSFPSPREADNPTTGVGRAGNPPRTVKCPKRKVRKKGRCVKSQHRHRNHKRNRGAHRHEKSSQR